MTRASELWLVAVCVGALAWLDPEIRWASLHLFWAKLIVVLICSIFAAWMPVRWRSARPLAAVTLLVVCWMASFLGVVVQLRELRLDLAGDLVGGLGLAVLPVIATVVATLYSNPGSGGFRAFQLGVFNLVIAPISTLLGLAFATLFLGRQP